MPIQITIETMSGTLAEAVVKDMNARYEGTYEIETALDQGLTLSDELYMVELSETLGIETAYVETRIETRKTYRL